MIFFIPKSPRDFSNSGIDIDDVSLISIIKYGIAVIIILLGSYYLADYIFKLINQ